MLKSKRRHPKDWDDLIASLKSRFNVDNDYIEFLRKYNVVDFKGKKCIKFKGSSLPIEIIFGFSKKENEDLVKINDFYENRIPDNCLAIASVNYGDLLCLTKKGNVRYWNHEVNDLYFNDDGDGYKKQNTNLSIIAKSFDLFLGLIEEYVDDEEDEEAEEDEYSNPNIPFPDSSLDYDFKHPEVFFKNPEHRILIYLKKLELSEKGKKLLEKFKEIGLL